MKGISTNRFIIATVIFWLMALRGFAWPDGEFAKTGLSNNYLEIEGSTNFNEFSLENTRLEFDAIHFKNNRFSQGNDSHKPEILIPVKDFKCENRKLCRDFQKMVNEKEYPDIKVSIHPNEKIDIKQKPTESDFNVDIFLAGVSRNFVIPCEITPYGGSVYKLSGRKKIKLSDFQIDPPKKVFGIIQVKNEVFINFSFMFVVE